MKKVYIETSVISYFVAKPSKNPLARAQQIITTEFFNKHAKNFSCFISSAVTEEAALGDKTYAKKRLDLCNKFKLVEPSDAAQKLAEIFLKTRTIPAKAYFDALHIAVATVEKADFLLSLNFKHIANANIYKKLDEICAKNGYDKPLICSPQELIGDKL